MLDNPVTQQRPVLHQSAHTVVPPEGAFACRKSSRLGMNFSAPKACRNRPSGGLRCSAAILVTAVGVALLLVGQTEPAAAARNASRAPSGSPWGTLFRDFGPKPRRSARATPVPLPRPRPAEAPVAPADEAAAGKQP